MSDLATLSADMTRVMVEWKRACINLRDALLESTEALTKAMFVLTPPPGLEPHCTNEQLNAWLFQREVQQ